MESNEEKVEVKVRLMSEVDEEKVGINPKITIKEKKAMEEKEQESTSSEKKAVKLSTVKIIWAFISFIISVADVTVILYLSYLHFSHSSDLVAWLMLLPILLNFIGMYTFLSNKKERREMESLGCKRTKNLMFFPVIGPSYGAFRLFSYAFEEKNAEKFERLESLLLRMKQYESYFRAAPEAFIQVTFRIINYSDNVKYHAEDHWTTACIILCIYSLAESHMYAGVIKYYRMFQHDPTENAWSTEQIPRRWKFLLFIYTYLSINSRIICDALQKATACFYFTNSSFGEVIIINFLCQFVFRASVYALYNTWMASTKRQIQMADEGVYGAFTYSWRCLFLSFDYQSYCLVVFLWYYIENILMIILPYAWIYGTPHFGGMENNILNDKTIFHIYSGVAIIECLLALGIKLTVRYHWKRQQKNKITASA